MIAEVRKDVDKHLTLITKFKKDFKIRRSPNFTEIEMTHSKQKLIFNDNQDFRKGLFLFSQVRKNVNDWLAENKGKIELSNLPVNNTNPKYDKLNNTIGIDLNHAYWRIAFLKGYINEDTYLKGLKEGMPKSVKLATLSTLGRPKSYDIYKQGKFSHTEKTEANNNLMDVYHHIRQSTYKIMLEIANALGNDFFCWRTDCIYFNNTEENCEIVITIVESHNIGWKYENKD
jgi:hypothetical protein